jgi:glutamate formiminotransferase/formiminotetrahydrofolate cyclodeaminase
MAVVSKERCWMDRIVECVPNFSEGRDRAVIDAIAGAVRSVEGVKLLNVDPGADFNRTVYTFVGGPEDVLEAAFRAARVGTALIDMTKHKGEHARMGALDVCPFIPIRNVTYEECDALAQRFGERVWKELGIPIYLYARSAKKKERTALPDIRKGEYEALPEKLGSEDFRPDIGEPVFVPKSGVTATGTREILIAFNVNLSKGDKAMASTISGRIRPSGTFKLDGKGDKVTGPDGKPIKVPGYLKAIQAGGMMYNENIAQVSMNLLDFKTTNLDDAFEACKKEAADLGGAVGGSEIVGLVPMESLVMAGRRYAEKEGMVALTDEKGLMMLAVERLGLDQLYKFEPEKKVIDLMVGEKPKLASMDLRAFLDELASSSPAPGGGSVAALSGALGAALVEMVGQLTLGKEQYRESWEEMRTAVERCKALRRRLLELVDEDTVAFNDVMSAFKMPKGTDAEKAARSAAIQLGYRKAIDTPLSTAMCCIDVMKAAVPVAKKGNRGSISDAGVGADMALAGLMGALMNVNINLPSIKDQIFVSDMRGRITELSSAGSELHGNISTDVKKALEG